MCDTSNRNGRVDWENKKNKKKFYVGASYTTCYTINCSLLDMFTKHQLSTTACLTT